MYRIEYFGKYFLNCIVKLFTRMIELFFNSSMFSNIYMCHLIIFICFSAYLSLRIQFYLFNHFFFFPNLSHLEFEKLSLYCFVTFTHICDTVSRDFKLDTSKKVEQKNRLQKTCFYEHSYETVSAFVIFISIYIS